MTTPTGEQYELRSGPYRAVVVQNGGGLRALTYGGRQVLDGYHADQSVEGGRGQLLAPWPNRIDHGRYRFGGKDHQLELTEPARDNAIQASSGASPGALSSTAPRRPHWRMSCVSHPATRMPSTFGSTTPSMLTLG